MPNKNYQRGRRFEYKIKNKLESLGFVVLRTSGSHGFADLVALKDNIVYFMQLKYGAPITKAEQQKMYNIMNHNGWGSYIHFMIVHGRPYKKTNWYELSATNELFHAMGEWNRD